MRNHGSPSTLRELPLNRREATVKRDERGSDVARIEVRAARTAVIRLSADVGWLALPAHDEALVLEQAERALDGADGDAVPGRHVGVTGQPLPRPERAARHAPPDRVGHLDVLRTRVVRIEFLHVGQLTTASLGALSISRLPRLSMLSTMTPRATRTERTATDEQAREPGGAG